MANCLPWVFSETFYVIRGTVSKENDIKFVGGKS